MGIMLSIPRNGLDYMSNNPNALQKAEAANLMVAQHTKVMRDAAVRVKDAIKPFTDEDRKRVIDIALEELGCKLAVRGN
jgi:hypothetical protein